MTPLSDPSVTSIEVLNEEAVSDAEPELEADSTLGRDDCNVMRLEDEVEESSGIYDVDAQMTAINFDNARKWRVKTVDQRRLATVEDEEFVGRVAGDLAIRETDIFRLRIREDQTKTNGRTQTT